MKKKILVAAIFASFGSLAFAESPGFYTGIGLGQSHNEFDADFHVSGYTSSSDGDHIAWKLFAGYEFNSNWAVEAGYTNFGSVKYTWLNAPDIGKQERQDSAWSLAVKGALPVSEEIKLFAKLGLTLNRNETKYDETISGIYYRAADSVNTHTDTLVGVGAEYLPMKNFGVRAEYEKYGRFGDGFDDPNGNGRTNIDLWSVSTFYKF